MEVDNDKEERGKKGKKTATCWWELLDHLTEMDQEIEEPWPPCSSQGSSSSNHGWWAWLIHKESCHFQQTQQLNWFPVFENITRHNNGWFDSFQPQSLTQSITVFFHNGGGCLPTSPSLSFVSSIWSTLNKSFVLWWPGLDEPNQRTPCVWRQRFEMLLQLFDGIRHQTPSRCSCWRSVVLQNNTRRRKRNECPLSLLMILAAMIHQLWTHRQHEESWPPSCVEKWVIDSPKRHVSQFTDKSHHHLLLVAASIRKRRLDAGLPQCCHSLQPERKNPCEISECYWGTDKKWRSE